MAFETGDQVMVYGVHPATFVRRGALPERYFVRLETGELVGVHPTHVAAVNVTNDAAELQSLESDMQDVLYGCLMHDRYDTSEQALEALLPIVRKYAAALTEKED